MNVSTAKLEAVPPDVIAEILKAAFERRIDWGQLADDLSAEEHDRVMISGLLPAPEGGRAT